MKTSIGLFSGYARHSTIFPSTELGILGPVDINKTVHEEDMLTLLYYSVASTALFIEPTMPSAIILSDLSAFYVRYILILAV